MNETIGQDVMEFANPQVDKEISKSSIILLLVVTLATLSDGYNISVMGYVAPALIRHWHIAPAALVPVFLAGIFGLLFGAPCLGYIGDRFGRKRAIMIALGSFGVFTFMIAFTNDVPEIAVLRFLAGLGLGGLIPNAIALAAESAPKRFRGMFITIVNFGIPAGFALPGLVAAAFVPRFGWPVLLFVGAILPLLTAIVIAILLQESPKFQAAHKQPDTKMGQAAAGRRGQGALAKLLSGNLGVITPAIWIAIALSQFSVFFTLSWFPTILQAAGFSTAQAGVCASMFSIGGFVGGVVSLLAIDRFGIIPILALFLAGGPLLLAVGIPHISPTILTCIMAAAGFCAIGINFGFNAVVGMIYPTQVRSIGAGYAQASGRLGALAAQIVGGRLLAKHISTSGLFLAPASTLFLGAIASAVILTFCIRRFGGFQLHDTAAADLASRSNTPDSLRAIQQE